MSNTEFEILDRKGNFLTVDFEEERKLVGKQEEQPHTFSNTYDEVFIRRVYENGDCKIEEGDVVVDIGANVGLFSRFAFLNGAKKVYSFEPSPRSFACLVKNVPNNCEAFNIGVMGTDSFLDMFPDDHSQGNSFYLANGNCSTKKGSVQKIPCYSLASLFDKGLFDHINFLKIDAEGAEKAIFDNLPDSYFDKIDKMSIEYHNLILNHDGSCDRFVERLSNHFKYIRANTTDMELSQLYCWKEKAAPKVEVQDGISVLGHGSFIGSTGYNNHTRNFFRALSKIVPTRVRNYTYVKDQSYLDELDHKILIQQFWADPPYKAGTPDISVSKENPINIILEECDHHYYYDKYEGIKIAYCVWESTLFPEHFFKKLLEYTQLWVPSPWARGCAIKQGYPEDRVKVVPEGVDGTVFFPEEHPKIIEEYKDERFKFLLFGRWEYRKSTTEIIRTFLETFDRDEPVDLVCSIDNPYAIGPHKGKTTEELLEMYELDSPRIKVKRFLSREDYVTYLKRGHVFVSCSRAEGWNLPLCVPEGKLVITNKGIFPIEDVKKGNFVLTHLNNYEKVINTMSRYTTEDIIRIDLCGDFEPIELTSEHPVFAIKRKQYGKSLFSKIMNIDPEWVKASSLSKGDIVIKTIVPKINANTIIDLKDIDDRLCFNEEKVWYNTGYNYKSELKTYNRFVDLKKLSFVFGWYIAEGCDGENRVWLTLNYKKEKEAIKWLKEIYEIFGVKGSYRENKPHHKLEVRVNSVLLAKFFSYFCGGNAHKKKIPEKLLYGNLENLKILIDSYVSGDGSINNNIIGCSTVSYQLARNLIIALERLGYKISCHKGKRPDFILSWREDNENGRHSNKSWWNKYGRAMLVKKVEVIEYDGYVYNLEVEKDNSYNLLNGTIHNCEAIASGIPTIASRHGGQEGFSNGVSLLVDIEEIRQARSDEKEIPGEFIEPNFDCLSTKMRYAYEHYDECKKKALMAAPEVIKKFSWENAADKALKYIKELSTKVESKKEHITVNYHFVDGAFLEVLGNEDKLYKVKFIDKQTNKEIYSPAIRNNNWARPNIKYFVDWKLTVENNDKCLFEHNFNAKDKKVFIVLDSKGMGDTVAWFPYVSEFGKKHECKLVVSSFLGELFDKNYYSDLIFVEPGNTVYDLYAQYLIGAFDNNKERNKNEWRNGPLQKVASDILGLEYKEIKPKLAIPNPEEFNFESERLKGLSKNNKYVCISEHGTMQRRYWNYSGGWQEVVDALKDKGYEVVVVSKETTDLKNIIRRTNISLKNFIHVVNGASLFMGVSSGPAWVVWALNVPTIMISGSSQRYAEFKETDKNIRIINESVCHGCCNDVNCDFARGNWFICPRKKDFECTKQIHPDMVLEAVTKLLG